jgi:hypothetical protein
MDPSSKQPPSISLSPQGLASAPPCLTLCHRGQSLRRTRVQAGDYEQSPLQNSGLFPFGHADPAKKVTMQLVCLACLRFCLHVALALIHRRLPQTTRTCTSMCVFRGLQATSSSLCALSHAMQINGRFPRRKSSILLV